MRIAESSQLQPPKWPAKNDRPTGSGGAVKTFLNVATYSLGDTMYCSYFPSGVSNVETASSLPPIFTWNPR